MSSLITAVTNLAVLRDSHQISGACRPVKGFVLESPDSGSAAGLCGTAWSSPCPAIHRCPDTDTGYGGVADGREYSPLLPCLSLGLEAS